MAEEGKYIYGIIGTDEARSFGPIGVGGRGDIVSTISYQDISAVISNFPMGSYKISKENLLAHQIVVERIVSEYTVLPTAAFTVAASAEEVRDFLRKRYRELTGLLKDMDNKIELGLTAYWKGLPSIFQEIVDENRAIRELKERVASVRHEQTMKDRIAVGEMVAGALTAKKETERDQIVRPLRKIALDLCFIDVRGDAMVFNAAFLVDRSREKEFDSAVERLDEESGERIRFKYIGPNPPYNFVNLRI